MTHFFYFFSVEFFNSIGEWFTSNSGTIDAIFSTLTTGGIGALIVYIAKTITQSRSNNAMVSKLAAVVKSNDEGQLDTKETLKAIVGSSAQLSAVVDKIGDKLASIEDNFTGAIDGICEKIVNFENTQNAMLDMFSVAYSNIKDENVRLAVQNIITNAKYGKTTVKEEVQAQLEDLKKLEAMQSELDLTVKATNDIIAPATASSETKNEAKGVNRIG